MIDVNGLRLVLSKVDMDVGVMKNTCFQLIENIHVFNSTKQDKFDVMAKIPILQDFLAINQACYLMEPKSIKV